MYTTLKILKKTLNLHSSILSTWKFLNRFVSSIHVEIEWKNLNTFLTEDFIEITIHLEAKSMHKLKKKNSCKISKVWAYFSSFSKFVCEGIRCPVGWGCRIHWLHLGRGVRPPQTNVLDMTLNNLMVRFQQCWSFGECGVPLHCHRSQVYSGPEW